MNGTLSRFAGLMEMLEVLNLDVNSLTALCPAVQNWTNLRIFTISDNSLIGNSRFIIDYYILIRIHT